LMADGNGPWSMVISLVDAGVPSIRRSDINSK
jgi:hypothetical protein